MKKTHKRSRFQIVVPVLEDILIRKDIPYIKRLLILLSTHATCAWRIKECAIVIIALCNSRYQTTIIHWEKWFNCTNKTSMDVEYNLMKSSRISDVTIGLDILTETFDTYIN